MPLCILPFPSWLGKGPGDGVGFRLPTIVAIVLLSLAACRQQQISPDDIQLELQASDSRVGETTLLLSVKDRDGNAINNPGVLKVRGDMSHPGMVPVFAEADESTDGVFSLPFQWTMAGGWIIEASLTLPNGDTAVENFSFEILSDAADGEMSTMDHNAMDAAPGETSAVYMRISNRGATDHVIVAAQSAAAEHIDFHRTVVENDIARMEAIDALVIPAGETLELRPGGAHMMLSGLNQDLKADHKFSLALKCSTGAVYEVDVSIADMLMGDLDDAVEFGDLVFSNRWARPASAGSMAHADMPMNSDAEEASG